MDTLAFYPTWGFANEPATRAARMIAEEAPGDLDEVFFVSSGSEAVESALKFARNYHLSQGDEGRYKVIARDWAYHGTTLGALAVTGIPKFRAPFAPMLWDGVVTCATRSATRCRPVRRRVRSRVSARSRIASSPRARRPSPLSSPNPSRTAGAPLFRPPAIGRSSADR